MYISDGQESCVLNIKNKGEKDMKKQYKNWTKGMCMAAACLMLVGCGQKETIQTEAKASVEESTEKVTLEIAESSSVEETVTVSEKKMETSKKEEDNIENTIEENMTKENPTETEDVTKQGESATEIAEKPEETEKPEEMEASSVSEQTVQTKSVNEIYQEIKGKVELHSMVSMPDEFITNYYGVDTDALEEYIFAMSEDAVSAETVIIMKAKDSEKIHGLPTALQMVIDEKKAEMENYLPEQYDIVSKSDVKVSGAYVYLVISDHADQIQNIIQNEIS